MKFSTKDLIKKGYDVEKNKKLLISFNRMLSEISYVYEKSEKGEPLLKFIPGYPKPDEEMLVDVSHFIEDIKKLVIIYDNKVCIFSNNTIIEEMGKEINSILDLTYKLELNDYTKRKKAFLLSLQKASAKAFLLGRMDLNIPKSIVSAIMENIALIESTASKLQSLK